MQRIINDMSQQVSRLNVERYSLLLEQEERKAEYIRKVEMLEGQILSLQMIVSESEQHQDSQTAERLQEQIRSLEAIINETEAQMSERESHVSERERVHLKEVEKLQQRKARNQESIACSICLSSWEESGEHRVVCLACGHLFGESCIRESLQRSSACPICRQAASDTEIRYIFCGNILAIET
ncbi:hypothetical protein KR018_004406 [Drosophila ironensis]|nr:hypothetical protein KR018_004406 [Drosophila ironensis]